MRRCEAVMLIAAVALALPSLATAAKSRTHAQQQKELIKAKKMLAEDLAEVKDFAQLLQALDSAGRNGVMSRFWKVNSDVRVAMEREWNEAATNVAGLVHVQDAAIGPAIGLESALEEAADVFGADDVKRMQSIIIESDGLQNALALGDTDVMGRYQYLLGEFLGLMRADTAATADAIEREWANL